MKQILLEFIKQRSKGYLAGLAIHFIATLVALRVPKVLGVVTDGLNLKSMTLHQVYMQVLVMLLLVLLAFALKYVWRYFLIGNCRNVESFLRAKLFAHLQTLPVSFYNQNKTGDLIAHAINDIQAIRIVFGFGVVAILEGVLINAVSIFYMAQTIHPFLTLMALGPVPLVILLTILLRKTIRKQYEKVQEAFATISEKVQENMMGIRVVKAFAQEQAEIERLEVHSQARVDTQMKLTGISGLLGPITQVCFGISFLLFFIYGSRMVTQGDITLGDFIAFNTYMATIMAPVMNVSRIIEVWQRGLASMGRLDRIFAEKGHSAGTLADPADLEIKGEVKIQGLTFAYPEDRRSCLKNINLTIPAGSTLGILGMTGSGKTTLANLLLRLFPVEDGRIYIDGVDINKIPVDILRQNIGYVPQENFLFSSTIRQNIEFYQQGITDAEIEQAARLSGVYDNILAFPLGFDTVVGERGVTLSGGQRQRISIARALVKNPAILILDDSLSAVDTKTEAEVLENIRNVLANRTGILISHRVSTVMHADWIVIMERGKILEQGRHEELMALHGRYYALYAAQHAEYREQEMGGIIR